MRNIFLSSNNKTTFKFLSLRHFKMELRKFSASAGSFFIFQVVKYLMRGSFMRSQKHLFQSEPCHEQALLKLLLSCRVLKIQTQHWSRSLLHLLIVFLTINSSRKKPVEKEKHTTMTVRIIERLSAFKMMANNNQASVIKHSFYPGSSTRRSSTNALKSYKSQQYRD